MPDQPAYGVICTRSGPCWTIEVPDLGLTTEVRRLDQVEPTGREAIARRQGIDPATVEVAIEVVRLVPHQEYSPLERELVEVLEARAQVEELQARVAARTRDVARGLVAAGLTVRDAGQLLGLSHQRVAQLLHD